MSFSFGNLGSGLGGAEKKTGTLFGSTTAPAGGLFGQSQQQQQQPQQQQQTNATQSGLFGSTAAPQNNSLFGSTQQQQTGGSSLFGQPQQQQQQQQQQQNAGSSLFGQPQQQQQQQPQQQQQNLSNSLFGASLQPAPPLNQVQAQAIQQQREGLPQLRQSSSQAFAGSSTSGHSMYTDRCHIKMLNYNRGEVGRRTDTDTEQQMGSREPRMRFPALLLQRGQARRSALLWSLARRGREEMGGGIV